LISVRERALGQRVALNELENERGYAVQVFEAVNAADVRMVQRRQQARFPIDAGAALRMGLEPRGRS
jgi:hypothetical protein